MRRSSTGFCFVWWIVSDPICRKRMRGNHSLFGVSDTKVGLSGEVNRIRIKKSRVWFSLPFMFRFIKQISHSLLSVPFPQWWFPVGANNCILVIQVAYIALRIKATMQLITAGNHHASKAQKCLLDSGILHSVGKWNMCCIDLSSVMMGVNREVHRTHTIHWIKMHLQIWVSQSKSHNLFFSISLFVNTTGMHWIDQQSR